MENLSKVDSDLQRKKMITENNLNYVEVEFLILFSSFVLILV